jgi:putative membrane protein
MTVNYITLMLLNLSVGMFLLASFLWRGLETPRAAQWAPGFALVGAVGLVTGAHMTLTWPVPGAYNIAFGEMNVLFSVLLLALAAALARGWNLLPLGAYALLAGIAAIIVGIRIMDLGMTLQPTVAGIAFILSGGVGVLAVPLHVLRGAPAFRLLAIVFAAVAGVVWGLMAYAAYWSHLSEYEGYKVPGIERPGQAGA